MMNRLSICFQMLALKLLAFSPYFLIWVAVWMMGMSLLPERLARVKNDFRIGHADTAAYAWQGRQLAKGEGWHVPYVTNYLYTYDRERARYDDQWGPLLSFALAPAFYVGEDTAEMARMTTVWISTIFLPMSLCLLVQGVTLRAWPGLLGALPVWFSMALFEQSTEVYNDQLFTAVLCLFLAALVGSRKIPWLLWLCGPLIALAWYGKGSQIILFPFFAMAVLLLHGPRALIHRNFLGGLLLALLLMFPRLRESAEAHGQPLHSTQSVVSSYFGLHQHWDQGFYSIYWGRDLPGLENRFEHPVLHAKSMMRNSEFFLRHLLLGLDAKLADWTQMGEGVALSAKKMRKGEEPPEIIWAEVNGDGVTLPLRSKFMLCAIGLGIIGLVTVPGEWLFALCSGSGFPMKSQRAAAAILVVFVVIQAGFIIVCWHSILRLYYPALLITPVLLWTLLPLPRGRLTFPLWAPPLLTVLFIIAVGLNFREALPELKAQQVARFKRPPFEKPQYPRVQGLAEPLAQKLPADAVIMMRNPWEILWYAPAGLRGVGMPFSPPQDLLAVAQYYQVTHVVFDRERPGLKNFIQAHPEVFTPVIQKPWRVYKIEWSQLDHGWLTPLSELQPLWDPRLGLAEEEERWEKKWDKERAKRMDEAIRQLSESSS
ncbi:hypothetical protein P3T73_00620 [Kiritimatiellota bacterium B12222]|nr:hypothetical protein P3T73_00620 [Kiritimatiellota bacterium B12222]